MFAKKDEVNMNCKFCGYLIEDSENKSVCPKCGNSLVDETVEMDELQALNEEEFTFSEEEQQQIEENDTFSLEEEEQEGAVENETFAQELYEKNNNDDSEKTVKRNKNGIIAVVAGVVLIACIVVVIAVMKDKNKQNDDTTQAVTNETNTTTGNTQTGEEKNEEETVVGDYSKYKEYVTTLGNYKSVEVNMVPEEVTDEQVEARISSILVQSTKVEEITDRTDVQEGDIANIDFTGYMDGEVFDGGSGEAYELTIGSGQFIDGFEDQLIGTKVGETVSIDLKFPEEYQNADVAGKPVTFEVKINSISQQIVPELTEEWLAENTESTSVEDYKKAIRITLEEEVAQNLVDTKGDRILQTIVENSTIESYPQEEVDGFVDYMMSYYEYVATYTGTTLEEYVASFGFTLEDFTAYLTENAKISVASQMICYSIAMAENMTLTEEEYKTGAMDYATQAGYATVEEFETAVEKSKIYDQLIMDKVLSLITENAVEVVE